MKIYKIQISGNVKYIAANTLIAALKYLNVTVSDLNEDDDITLIPKYLLPYYFISDKNTGKLTSFLEIIETYEGNAPKML